MLLHYVAKHSPVELRNADIAYGLLRHQLKGQARTRRSVTSDMRRSRQKYLFHLTFSAALVGES